MSDNDAEQAVRAWLMYVDDPDSLRDDAALPALEAAVGAATDPLDRLKAMSALRAARSVDPEPHRKRFVRHARSWAQANGVAPEDFLEMGVSPGELADAGFEVDRPDRPKRDVTTPPVRKRAPRVDAVAMEQTVLSRTDPFTLGMIREECGGAEATVRKVVIDRLLREQNRVRELTSNEAPRQNGRGHPAKWYVVKRGL